jgi:hypothetical protein
VLLMGLSTRRNASAFAALSIGRTGQSDGPRVRVDQIDAAQVPPGVAQAHVREMPIPGGYLQAMTLQADGAIGAVSTVIQISPFTVIQNSPPPRGLS